MGADVGLPLIGYLLLLAAGMLWIAVDAETAYIFDVFGKNFDYMWRHSGQRWKLTFMYGWRLLALLLLVAICSFLAWLIAGATTGWQSGAVILFLFIALAVTPCILFPWIDVTSQWRFQRSLRNTARQLTPVVESLAAAEDLTAILDDSQYRTEFPWTAWHPKTTTEWPGVAPVAYFCSQPAVTIIFPVDFSTFLAWKLENQLPIPGELLPFYALENGPLLLQGVWPLNGVPDWSLVHAEIQWPDELPENQSGNEADV